jgi:hypothetical protein
MILGEPRHGYRCDCATLLIIVEQVTVGNVLETKPKMLTELIVEVRESTKHIGKRVFHEALRAPILEDDKEKNKEAESKGEVIIGGLRWFKFKTDDSRDTRRALDQFSLPNIIA